MPDAIAPYRADEVGSLLRSAPLKEARSKRAEGEITPAQLSAVEDEEIRKIVRKQAEIGLKLATDGEFRRTFWQLDFFGGLDGAEVYDSEKGFQFKGIETPKRAVRVTGKLDFPADHPMLEHFYFMEWDTERAGGLEPLRFLPKGKKRVVVGLVTSKTGVLEKKDDIKH
jgi:methionine synthase II (cobalamin-independent)